MRCRFHSKCSRHRRIHLPSKSSKPGYRLPTAGEWELACRAGTRTQRSYGSGVDRLNQYAWFIANAEFEKKPFGLLKPNESGLFDMLGNVGEMCLDWYHRELHPELNPAMPWIDFSDNRQSPFREYRGGSYKDEASQLQTAIRKDVKAQFGFSHLGFRIARTYPDPNEAVSSASE